MDILDLSSSGYDSPVGGTSDKGDAFGEVSTGFGADKHRDKQS